MKKSLIDFIKWSGEKGVLAYRHPQANVSKYAKLQVGEAQEAVVIVNGTKSQKFGPGQYTLDSPNFPILRAFYGIPFGGENPWTVQVWFVNKLTPKDVEWQISQFPVFDSTFQAQIPIMAQGRYGITVSDAERLIIKLAMGYSVGSAEDGGIQVTADDFTRQLDGELNARAKSLITRIFKNNQYGISDIAAHLEDISNILNNNLGQFFDEFGCTLSKFYVSDINIDTSTEAGQVAQEAINQRTAQKISGHTWQQSKMFDTMQQAVGNQSGGGIMGAVMMAGMFGGFGGGNGMGGSVMAPAYDQPGPAPQGFQGQQNPVPQIKEVFCSNCSKKFTSDNRFCPHCGDPYNPCPRCGADNEAGATRCVTCGSPLQSTNLSVCPACGGQVPQGTRFCPSCGHQMAQNSGCPRCGAPVGNTAFCPNCGMKIR